MASALLLAVVVCLVAQIAARSLFSVGLPWSGELARFLAVWCALFGATAAFADGSLHRIELVVARLAPPRQRLTLWFCRLAVLATLVAMLVSGIMMTLRAAPQLSSAMQISMAWVYAALPTTAVLMLCSLVADCLSDLAGGRRWK